MMALIPTSTFPTFPLGAGDVSSAASRSAKRSLLLSSVATRSASPAEHSSGFPDNVLESPSKLHSSRKGFSAAICEILVMCVVPRITFMQLKITPATSPTKWCAQLEAAGDPVRPDSTRCHPVYSFSAMGICVQLPHHTHDKTHQCSSENMTGLTQVAVSHSCIWDWDGEAMDCIVKQTWLGLVESGQKRKPEGSRRLGLQQNNNHPKAKSITQRLCFCTNVGVTQTFLWVWSITSSVPVQCIGFIASFLSSLTEGSPSCAMSLNRGKPGVYVAVSVRSMCAEPAVYGPETDKLRADTFFFIGFFNKNNWKVGNEVLR